MASVAVIVRPLNILGTIVLARMLEPSDFGAVALAMVLLGTSYMFVGLGMGSALIHSDEDPDRVAFQAFTVTAIAGLALFILLKVNIEFVASLLGNLDVVVFNSLLPILLLTALTIVPESMLSKQMLFSRVSIATIVSEIAYLIIAILLAWLGYGLWSLVYGRLGSSLIKMLITWFSNPTWAWIIPKRWDWSLQKRLFKYGLPTTGGGMVSYFHTHWDDWYVGRHFGTQSLGYYTKAYDFSNKTLSSLSRTIINGVFFPSYSRVRDDKDRLRNIFLKGTRVVLLLMVPISLGLLVVAPELVPVILGEKWIPMIPLLQIYSFMVLFRPISSNAVPFFMGVGRPHYVLYAGIVLSIVMVPAVLILSAIGVAGVAIAVAISHFVGAGYSLYLVNRVLPGVAKASLRDFVPFVVVGTVMAVSVQLLKPYVMSWAGETYALLGVLVLVAIGAIIYLALIFLAQRDLIIELIELTVSAISLGERFPRFSFRERAK